MRFISLETLTSEVTGPAQSGQMLPGWRDGGGEVDGGRDARLTGERLAKTLKYTQI